MTDKPSRQNNSHNADLAAIQQLHETDMAAAKIHDIDTLITLMTDDCILLPPGQEPIRGRDEIWKFMQGSCQKIRNMRSPNMLRT